MSAFCACFKSNAQVTDNASSARRGRGGNRQSIVKGNGKEMDLLELNKRGMNDEEEWIDGDDGDPNDIIRASNETDLLMHRKRQQYEDSNDKAIDDFMRSPKKTIVGNQPQASSGRTGRNSLIANNGANNSLQKTGVCVSKSYNMLCGRCGRRFTKIMIVELTADADGQTAFEIQAYFNSSQNHDYDCPFCYQKAQIILSEQMLVGDAQQLDYQKTLDKASQQERLRLAQLGGATTGSTAAGTMIPAAAGQAMSSLGLASGYLAGDKATASDNHSQDPALLDEAIETRPQLLYTKFQRLKNTTKLAKVIVVDEMPVARPPGQSSTDPQDKLGNTRQSYSEDASVSEPRGSAVQNKGTPFDKYQQHKALLYYPEECHLPDEQACQSFNSRVMKNIMKQKMQKNKTFYETKVLNGENNFLKRQMSSGAMPVTRQRPARQVSNSIPPVQENRMFASTNKMSPLAKSTEQARMMHNSQTRAAQDTTQ